MGNSRSSLAVPSDIMIEIFLLLPSESVIACKRVCKKWKNLIKSSNFIKHYKDDAMTFYVDNQVLKSVFQTKDKKFYESRQIGKYARLCCHLQLLLESSNKIACMKVTCGRFLLYNLLTGDLRVVADAPVRTCLFPVWPLIGFGYDPYEDDYKIIVMCRSSFRLPDFERKRFGLNENDTKRNSIFIYSYKKGSWKHREGFEESEYDWSVNEARGFAVNGVLHWILPRSNGTKFIAGLDLNTYGLAQFKLPPISVYDELCEYSNLTSFKGRLSCFVDGAHLDVWVMEEYGVTESWTMLLRISRSQIGTGFPSFEHKDMRIYEDRDSREIVVLFHNEWKSKSFGYDAAADKKQAYIKTLSPNSNNNIQLHLQRLKTWFKQVLA